MCLVRHSLRIRRFVYLWSARPRVSRVSWLGFRSSAQWPKSAINAPTPSYTLAQHMHCGASANRPRKPERRRRPSRRKHHRVSLTTTPGAHQNKGNSFGALAHLPALALKAAGALLLPLPTHLGMRLFPRVGFVSTAAEAQHQVKGRLCKQWDASNGRESTTVEERMQERRQCREQGPLCRFEMWAAQEDTGKNIGIVSLAVHACAHHEVDRQGGGGVEAQRSVETQAKERGSRARVHPFGCCNPTGCGRPPAASRRRSGAAGPAGCPPCPGS